MSEGKKVYRGYLMETGEIWEADDFRTVYKILVSHMKDYIHDAVDYDRGFVDCSGRICVTSEGTDFWHERMSEDYAEVTVFRMLDRCLVFVMRYDWDEV